MGIDLLTQHIVKFRGWLSGVAGTQPPLAAQNQGTIYYDASQQAFLKSENLSDYVPFGSASPAALNQVAWFIDEINGDDRNSGATAGAALASLYEYVRRIGSGTVAVATTISLLTDVTLDDGPLVFRGSYADLTIQGIRTVVRTGGSITALQIWDAAINDDGRITDAAVASWVPEVGQMLVLTSGAEIGATAWIAVDTGGGSDTCRYSPFWDAGAFGTVDPSVADDYDVVTLSTIGGAGGVEFSGAGFVTMIDVHFDNPGFPGCIRLSTGQHNIITCQFSGTFGAAIGGGNVSQVSIVGSFIETDLNPAFAVTFYSGSLLTSRQSLGAGCKMTIDECHWQDSQTFRVSSGASFRVFAASFLSVWDVSTAGLNIVAMNAGSTALVQGRIFGLNNDGAACRALVVDSGGVLTYLTDAVLRFGIFGATLVETSIADDITETYVTLGLVGSNGANTERLAAIVPGVASF